MTEFSDALKNMLRECSPVERTLIATLECEVVGLSSTEKLERIMNFAETGDIGVISVRSATKLDEMHKRFEGDVQKIVLHIVG